MISVKNPIILQNFFFAPKRFHHTFTIIINFTYISTRSGFDFENIMIFQNVDFDFFKFFNFFFRFQ